MAEAPRIDGRFKRGQEETARNVLLVLSRSGPRTVNQLKHATRKDMSDLLPVLKQLENAEPPYATQVGQRGPWKLASAGAAWVTAAQVAAQARREAGEEGEYMDPVDIAADVARRMVQIEAERDEALAQAQQEIDAKERDVTEAGRMLAEAEQQRAQAVQKAEDLLDSYQERLQQERGRLRALLAPASKTQLTK